MKKEEKKVNLTEEPKIEGEDCVELTDEQMSAVAAGNSLPDFSPRTLIEPLE